jgi:polysaccharide biosynthesis/export protein
MKPNYKIFTRCLILALMSIMIISCIPTKELKYFNDINEMEENIINPREQKVIMPFDNLYIKILSIDPQTNQIFNANEGQSGNQFLINYFVDEKGKINFPFVGDIQIGGLLLSQASTKIQSALSEYVSRTSIIVRYVDNQVDLLVRSRTREFIHFHRTN